MKLHTFIAEDNTKAMEQVKQSLGADAMIISSNKESGGKVRVVAALDKEPIKSNIKPFTPPTVEQKAFQKEFLEVLRYHKIPLKICEELFESIKGRGFENISEALEEAISANFKFSPLSFSQPKPVMVFGMPGIGKTLGISKMMTEAVFYERKPKVITTDIKRAGGVEQLSAFTKILGLQLKVCVSPAELKEEIEQTSDEIILIDTAGVNPYSDNEIDALADLANAYEIEPILVMPAGTDVEESVDMCRVFHQIKPSRLIVTKADSARRFGSIITTARILGIPFANFSGTPNVAKNLEPITAKSLTDLLLSPFSKNSEARKQAN